MTSEMANELTQNAGNSSKEESKSNNTSSKRNKILIYCFLVSLPLLFILLMTLRHYSQESALKYWDEKVKELCQKDGGLKIFNKASISHEDYLRLGGKKGVIPIVEEKASSNSPFYVKKDYEFIYAYVPPKTGNSIPRVTRVEKQFIQKEGNITLASFVYYFRRGGNSAFGKSPFTFSCPEIEPGMTKKFIQINNPPKPLIKHDW